MGQEKGWRPIKYDPLIRKEFADFRGEEIAANSYYHYYTPNKQGNINIVTCDAHGVIDMDADNGNGTGSGHIDQDSVKGLPV